MGSTAGAIVTAVNVLLVVALSIYVLRAKTWKRLSLDTNINYKAVPSDLDVEVGDRGVTITRLAPMGSARFSGLIVEVKALEGLLDPGVDVEVVLIEEGKIYVRPVVEEY